MIALDHRVVRELGGARALERVAPIQKSGGAHVWQNQTNPTNGDFSIT
jgi:hypothetical protein